MTVHSVIIQVKPSDGDDPGQISEGYYTLDGNLLTMTYADGTPVKSPPTEFEKLQLLYQHTLEPNDSEKAIAVMLTKRIRMHMKGIFTEEQTSFNRPLTYHSEGLA